MLASHLLGLYKEEYIGEGGGHADVTNYTAQSLTRKIKDHFQDKISIELLDQRRSNFIYISTLSVEDAKARLHEDAEQYEEGNKLI